MPNLCMMLWPAQLQLAVLRINVPPLTWQSFESICEDIMDVYVGLMVQYNLLTRLQSIWQQTFWDQSFKEEHTNWMLSMIPWIWDKKPEMTRNKEKQVNNNNDGMWVSKWCPASCTNREVHTRTWLPFHVRCIFRCRGVSIVCQRQKRLPPWCWGFESPFGDPCGVHRYPSRLPFVISEFASDWARYCKQSVSQPVTWEGLVISWLVGWFVCSIV